MHIPSQSLHFLPSSCCQLAFYRFSPSYFCTLWLPQAWISSLRGAVQSDLFFNSTTHSLTTIGIGRVRSLFMRQVVKTRHKAFRLCFSPLLFFFQSQTSKFVVEGGSQAFCVVNLDALASVLHWKVVLKSRAAAALLFVPFELPLTVFWLFLFFVLSFASLDPVEC